ncbi:MAG: squalene/phytoene synthase family protein [Verrucomicrobia bacterium]|nr:squalene/phytoene synthase family protein [Verrucomicrobiota bacterium]
MMEEHELGGKLLAGVSRSFYLTLKALPGGLREPLSIAYLLARAADTIADTASVADDVRLISLRDLGQLVQINERDENREKAFWSVMQRDFAAGQTDADEAELMRRLPELFDAFYKLSPRQITNIRGVLSPIVRGQRLDIERFPVDGRLRTLGTAAELDEYTWLVAGCVGEFWTKLCAEEEPAAYSKNISLEKMMELGRRYGQGLQLVNILRDIGKDFSMGRCYFPQEEISAQGLEMESVRDDAALLAPVIMKWQRICREHLQCGIDYVDSVELKRLRYATALPLLIGLRTLDLIEKADWPERLRGVKASRGEVGKIMFDAGIAVLRRGGVRKLAEKLSHS